MFNKRPRDSFTFSLGGMTTVAPFTVAPVVEDDRINRIRDAQRSRAPGDSAEKPQFWRRLRRQPA